MTSRDSSLTGCLTTGTVLGGAWLLAVVFAEPLRELDRFLEEYGAACLWATGALTAAGVILLAGGAIHDAILHGQPMTEQELDESQVGMQEAFQKRGNVWSKRWFWGKRVGRQFEREHSFAAIKAAVRSGAWWQPEWRGLFAMLVGSIALLCGLFGFLAVGVPSWLKIFLAGWLLYATVQLTWGFWRA